MSLGSLVVVVGCSSDAPTDPAVASASGALSAAQCDYFAAGGKVTICHATGSTKNPIVVLRVSDAACATAHASQPADRVAVDGKCGPDACLPMGAPHDPTVPCCDGLAPSGGTCADVDECATGNGGCDQMCANSPGGFSCSCNAGYALAADGRSCEVVTACVDASSSGLVAWWRGDGDALDASGNGNHGALASGASFAAGRFGSAFSFDGESSYVSVPDSPSLAFGTGDFTIAFWVNPRDLEDGGDGMLHKDSWNGSTAKGWHFNRSAPSSPCAHPASPPRS